MSSFFLYWGGKVHYKAINIIIIQTNHIDHNIKHNHNALFYFFEKLFMQPKWLSSTRKCRKNGDCPLKDLAKFGYKPYMKYKYSIISI
jgi:hypothetical protein